MRACLGSLATLLLVVSASGADDPAWKEFSPKDGTFKVTMLGVPKPKQMETESDFGKGVLNMNAVEFGKAIYAANYSDFPEGIKKFPSKQVLDSSRDGAIANMGGKLASEKDLKLGTIPVGRSRST